MAAIDAGRQPAPGTYKAASAEIEDTLRALKIHVWHCLLVANEFDEADKCWELTLSLARLQGSMQAQGSFEAGLRKVVREVEQKEHQPQDIISSATAMEATKCSNCHKRDAKVWQEGVAYCKPCAKELGIDFHGKV